jgi:hypothetical protein
MKDKTPKEFLKGIGCVNKKQHGVYKIKRSHVTKIELCMKEWALSLFFFLARYLLCYK